MVKVTLRKQVADEIGASVNIGMAAGAIHSTAKIVGRVSDSVCRGKGVLPTGNLVQDFLANVAIGAGLSALKGGALGLLTCTKVTIKTVRNVPRRAFFPTNKLKEGYTLSMPYGEPEPSLHQGANFLTSFENNEEVFTLFDSERFL